MVWNNLIIGYHALHNSTKAYANVVNAISTFVDPTSLTKIITSENILTQ